MFDIKKYFPDDLEITDFQQKQFHCKWMCTYTYVGIPQSVSGSALKEFVYEFVYKFLLNLQECVCVCVCVDRESLRKKWCGYFPKAHCYLSNFFNYINNI